MMLFKLILASLFSRKWMVLLTCFSIAISMLVLVSVSHIELQVRQSFERSVSGVDLIVGSRTSQLNLLLFSIFRIGYPSNNVSWQSFTTLASDPKVSWAVPIVLGDSHRGYAVVGTTSDYFEHVKFAEKEALSLNKGQLFDHGDELVIGASVAQEFGYQLNQQIILSHGAGKVSFTQHKDHPFKVVGILNTTGTPIDRAIYIPLGSVDKLHDVGAHHSHEAEEHEAEAEPPSVISAALFGVSNKISLLSLQRSISQSSMEPLSAILPGVALRELWQLMSAVEMSLRVIAILVLVASLIGMMTMLLASMRERQRELAILRALGASPWVIVFLVESEAFLITLFGCITGYIMLIIALVFVQPYLIQHYAFVISAVPDPMATMTYMGLAVGFACLLALVPALSSYRKSLSGGLRLT
ncbi:FtsX-like permease family protein [Paraglaciecola sp. 25GB23A]|uniref:ABC transporter permease n=1 Tax=Paraglaciecola sp. 25GB23A TaxID=3156068 RepID=UPI0032AEA863